MLFDFAKEHCVSEKDLTLRAFASLLRLALKMKLSESHWYNDTDRGGEKPKHSEEKPSTAIAAWNGPIWYPERLVTRVSTYPASQSMQPVPRLLYRKELAPAGKLQCFLSL